MGKAKGTNYAFLVACARYDKTELEPITGEETINDVVEFKKALLATGFDDGHIVMLHDRQAEAGGAGAAFLPEHDKVLKKLKALLARTGEGDAVVVALSGHGVHFAGEKTGYFCPSDAKLGDRSTLIPLGGPGGLFDLFDGFTTVDGNAVPNCKARTKLLVVNACRDTPAARRTDLAGDPVEPTNEYPERAPEGIAAIYSCDVGQKSYVDPDRKRSVFFQHLTDAWAGGGKGPVSVEAVFAQAVSKTSGDPYLVKNDRVQTPVVRRKYEGEWVIAAAATAGANRKKRPSLGFVPGNYEDDGKGVLVESLTKDGPGQQGGMREGDYIIEVAGTPVRNMTDYISAMSKLGFGVAARVVVRRGDTEVALRVTP